MTRADWIAALLAYQGTPFKHQGRAKGVDGGVDCVGLLLCAAFDIGIESEARSIRHYSRLPDDRLFGEFCDQYMVRKPYNRLLPIQGQYIPGDVIVFWLDDTHHPRHIGVLLPIDDQGRPTFIHSYAKEDRGVCIVALTNSYWLQRVYGLWQLPQFGEE